ncbi:MAG: alcohol dehydrogenase catalytic domain-containing protein [Anaerolineae bacterium]
MHALVYDGQLNLVEEYPQPQPPSGEVLIRVLVAGICNTDLEIIKGYMGFQGVLGHEFVGLAEDGELAGQRVVGEINCYCGTCPTCLEGSPTHCPNRSTLGIWGRDGALAEYLVLPGRNLHIVPEGVTDEEAVFVEPLAAALEILEQVHLKPTDQVIVLGDGKLGLLVAQVLSLVGCDLLAIGHHAHKLDILRRRGMAIHLASQGKNELDVKVDVVVDCSGHPGGFERARELVKPRGTIVLKSTFHGAVETAMTPLVVDEVRVVGSRCGPFTPALRLLERQLVDVRALIDTVYPLEDGLQAFEQASRPETLKVLIKPT